MYSPVHGIGGDELRVAKKIVERIPDPEHHAAELARLPSLEEFHGQFAAVSANVTHAREQLERHQLVRGRAALLVALAGGRQAPAPAVDHRTTAGLLLKPHGNPVGLRQLVGRMVQATASDEGELRALLAEVDGCPPAHQELAPRFGRIAILEARLPARRRALEQIRAALPRAIAGALGDRGDVIAAGIVEARTLRGQHGACDDGAARKELAAVESDIATLGGTSMAMAPGPLATELRARREAIRARLEAARAAHAQGIRAAAVAEVERVKGGDLDALVDFAQLVNMHTAAFPAGLADRLGAACYDALVKDDPQFWARCLERAGTRDQREF